jgi:hypothetical protein
LTDNVNEGNDIDLATPNAGRAGATPTASKLDMARVQRWAELIEGDPQARDFMRERVAGGELQQIGELTKRQRRLELALEHGIPAELAEVHLTADDPQLLEQQAESLARLLHSGGATDVGARRASPETRSGLSTTGDARVAPTNPLPAYEAAPVDREEWLTQQFVSLYQH